MFTLFPDEDVPPYKLVYYSFNFAGLALYQATRWNKIYIIYHWSIFHAFGIASILELYLGSRKLEDEIEALSGLAVYLTAFTKSVRCITRRTEMETLLNRLERIRADLSKDSINRNLLVEVDKFQRKFLSIMTVFLISTPFLSFIFTTLMDFITNFENKHLIVQVWIPWSMTEVWPYLSAKLVASLMSLSNVVTHRGLFFFDLIFTFQMSAYLRVLQKDLETKGVKDKEIYEQHKLLIQLINDYNEIMSGQKYLETLIAPAMPCGFGLTLIRGIRMQETGRLDSLLKIACCLMPPVIACSCGQQIASQVDCLHEASYMSNWYEEDPRCRKDLLMLMIRTTKVTTVNYRLFATFDHVYLAKVLQTIYSYFMLIINFDTA